MMKTTYFTLLLTLTVSSLFEAVALGQSVNSPTVRKQDSSNQGSLERGFRHPPEATKPWCYWYWISDNISEEGITGDLEAMARAGIGEALIGNIFQDNVPAGEVKVLSEPWWELIEHAILEGDRVGVNIGMFNCPGWSQSGGPWIKPEQAMRYLVSSETRVRGPVRFEEKLATPADPFQDVAVLAFPTPQNDADSASAVSSTVTSSPEGVGLEVDKMNRDAAKRHFDAFIGQLLQRVPATERRAWKHVVADSYETGSLNWTDGFDASFVERYGYDPMPWLPVLTGRIVGSANQSDRFLWDLRRLVADRVATDYVGALRDLCRPHGLQLWLENYGHWGFPAEFLQYGGQSDRIAGEYWVTGGLGSIECRAASSAANIYGKPIVSAEAFTGGPPFQTTPQLMKARGDWSLSKGININPWNNRLVGDAALPPAERTTFLAADTLASDAPLLPAGLLGPVTIETAVQISK